MTVFIVMPGWDYEGADADNEVVKAFRTRAGADAYADSIRHRYDWIEVAEQEMGE
jgi:hypothetical protein